MYTTQCPHCDTRFRLQPEQLDAADGLVRCGRCRTVFNARAHLEEEPAAETPVEPDTTTPAGARAEDFATPGTGSTAPWDENAPANEAQRLAHRMRQAKSGEWAAEPLKASSDEAELTPAGSSHDFDLDLPDLATLPNFGEVETPPPPAEAVEVPPLPPLQEERQPEEPTPEPEAPARNDEPDFASLLDSLKTPPRVEPVVGAAVSATTEPDFDVRIGDHRTPLRVDDEHTPVPLPEDRPVRPARSEKARKKTAGPKRSFAWLWLIGALLAAIALAAQLVYLFRTEIASQVPGARAPLEAACKALDCTVPLPRQSELLRTEWSEMSFIPEQSALVQLSATVMNHADYDMDWPYMQVTFKDASEHVLLKKVFPPKEWLPAGEQKQPAFAANKEVKVNMQLNLGTLRAQGYSISWVYP